MTFLGGFLSPALTAATSLATGAQQGNIQANEVQRQRALQDLALQRQQRLDELTAMIASGRVNNYNSLAETRGTGVTYKQDENGNFVALPKNAPLGAAGDPTSVSGGGSAAAPSLGTPTGVKGLTKPPTTRIQELPDGRRMQVERQPDGSWKPSMTAQGDTVFTGSPNSETAVGARIRSGVGVARGTAGIPGRVPYSLTPGGISADSAKTVAVQGALQLTKEQQAYSRFITQRIIKYRAPHTDPATLNTIPGLSPEAAATAAKADARASGQFPHSAGGAAPATSTQPPPASTNPFLQPSK